MIKSMNMRAVVVNGRLLMDEPTALPEGTVLDLVVNDEGDDLDEGEHEALHARLEQAAESLRQGRGRRADEVLAELRARR